MLPSASVERFSVSRMQNLKKNNNFTMVMISQIQGTRKFYSGNPSCSGYITPLPSFCHITDTISEGILLLLYFLALNVHYNFPFLVFSLFIHFNSWIAVPGEPILSEEGRFLTTNVHLILPNTEEEDISNTNI